MSTKNILLQLNQRPIAYYPIYVSITGGLTSGVLFSQLMYWYQTVEREFYKTDAEIMDETKLTPSELRTAKARLKQLNFVNIRVAGIPAKTYYDINIEYLIEAINDASIAESAKLEKRNPQSKKSEKKQAITENTSDNTSDNTTYIFSENEFSGEKIGDVANEFETYGEPEPISKKEKKKTPPSSASTSPRPTNIEYQMLESYAVFMEQKGIPVSRNEKGHVQFDKRAFKSCKEWAVWASGMPNATDTLNDWQQFLEAAWATGDKWLLANFEPNILYSKRTNIVAAIGAKQAKAKELMKSDGFIENLLGW